MILIRAGQVLGLLFLIGPISDLASSSDSPAQKAAIAVVLTAFVALYLAVWPPAPPLAQRGRNAMRRALVLLAALAALTLLLGAPGSFALLLWYVVAAAGLSLPAREAIVVTGVTAAAVAVGLAATGSDSSTVAAYTVSLVAVGAVMASLGSTTRANRKLREAREELARLAVAEERSRIARDLHDLLGHTLSLIALKTELAAKLVDSDPRRARTELEDVQEVTRHALSEVREAVQGYRRLARRRRARRCARRVVSGGDRLSDRRIDRRPSRRDRERARLGGSGGDDERRPPQRRSQLRDQPLHRRWHRRPAGRR